MTDGFKTSSKRKTSKIFLLLSLTIFLFWSLGWAVNVYHFPIIGAMFEFLWLPIILLTLILPILTFRYWAKEKFILRSLNFFSLIILLVTGLIIAFVYK